MHCQQIKHTSKLVKIVSYDHGLREVYCLKDEKHTQPMPKAKRCDYQQPRGHYKKSGNSVAATETDVDEEIEENTSPVSPSDEISSPEVDQFDVNTFQISWEYNGNDIFVPNDTYQPLMAIPFEETQDRFFFPDNDYDYNLLPLEKLDLF